MDSAHKEVDKRLEEMEKKLSDIYARAKKEVKEKADKYFAQFTVADKAMQEKVTKGDITEKDYQQWRERKMMSGKKWSDMRKAVTAELLNANKTATAYVNRKLPEIYALGYNAIETDTPIKGISFSLVDANTVRNLATSDKTLLPYKTVDGRKDERWNTQKVNAEVMQGIIQGESVNNIAKRLENVTEMNKASAVRNARTTTTSAENKGRMDSYEYAESIGIVMKKVWLSTHDGRTRPEHGELDGVEEDVDQPFVNGFGEIMYPGDPDAEPENIYNCRCTLVSDVKGFSSVHGAYSSMKRGLHPVDEVAARVAVERESQIEVLSQVNAVDSDIAEEYVESIEAWSGNAYKVVRKYQQGKIADESVAEIAGIYSDDIESFLRSAPKWEGGVTYRGVGISDDALAKYSKGVSINMNGTSSWTTSKEVALSNADKYDNKVVYACSSQKTGASIMPYSLSPFEYEVIASKNASYTIEDLEKIDDIVYVSLKEK